MPTSASSGGVLLLHTGPVMCCCMSQPLGLRPDVGSLQSIVRICLGTKAHIYICFLARPGIREEKDALPVLLKAQLSGSVPRKLRHKNHWLCAALSLSAGRHQIMQAQAVT